VYLVATTPWLALKSEPGEDRAGYVRLGYSDAICLDSIEGRGNARTELDLECASDGRVDPHDDRHSKWLIRVCGEATAS
jgi:hypothetical protein